MQPMMLAAILRIGGRAMTNKAYMAFVTSLSVTIALASHQAFGGPQQHPVEALLPRIRVLVHQSGDRRITMDETQELSFLRPEAGSGRHQGRRIANPTSMSDKL